MHDIVLKISFLELFGHFYFWALLESSENFDGLDAKLNVLENFQKKILVNAFDPNNSKMPGLN